MFNKKVLLLLLTVLLLDKSFGQSGIAPVISPVGGFAIDGYLQRQGAAGDWGAGPGGNQPGSVVPYTHIQDIFGSRVHDNVISKGRFQDNPNSYEWELKKPNSRTDIANTGFFITSDQSNNAWMIVYGDRLSSNGKSILEFEFLQNPAFPVLINSPKGSLEPKFISFGPHGGRTVGDIVISIGFNGALSTISFYRWTEISTGTYMYVSVVPSPGTAYAAFNTVDIAIPAELNFISPSYPAGTFAEAAVNMTTLTGGACIPLANTFPAILIKSRPDNGSSNENYDDFLFGPLFALSSQYSLSVDIIYLDLLSVQLTASVSPGTVDDYTFTWAPVGARINDVIDPSITGTLNNYNIYNPIFTVDPDHPCVPYLYEVTIAEKNNPGCIVARTHVLITHPCKIGKPINPDKPNLQQEIISEVTSNTKGIYVYPNPGKGVVKLILPNDDPRDIELISLNGSIIQRWQGIRSRNIESRSLASGVYLLKVISRTNGEVITKKIIVAQ